MERKSPIVDRWRNSRTEVAQGLVLCSVSCVVIVEAFFIGLSSIVAESDRDSDQEIYSIDPILQVRYDMGDWLSWDESFYARSRKMHAHGVYLFVWTYRRLWTREYGAHKGLREKRLLAAYPEYHRICPGNENNDLT